jgi:hypothetical protein
MDNLPAESWKVLPQFGFCAPGKFMGVADRHIGIHDAMEWNKHGLTAAEIIQVDES